MNAEIEMANYELTLLNYNLANVAEIKKEKDQLNL